MPPATVADMPIVLALADRVTGDDLDPIQACQQLDQPQHGLIHFSGKGRSEHDLLIQLKQMEAFGAQQLLLLSGDRLPGHHPEHLPVRYLESVCALQTARQHCPEWLLGAALNPFKYCEEDGSAQYLKARKKLLAGADFLTLQLGFDVAKHAEALRWMALQATPKPLLACVMAVTAKQTKFLKQTPGVVLSPGLEQRLKQEMQANPVQAQQLSVQRLALHIVGLKLMGFAGIHLSGIHQRQALLELGQALKHWQQRIDNLHDWRETWEQIWRDEAGHGVCFQPQQHDWQLGQSAVAATTRERLRYRVLSNLHNTLFSHAHPMGRAMGWALTQPHWQQPNAARWLHHLEQGLKRPLVGCESCGTCRLDQTLYVCPETCPKGLANGPCGGTQFNRCEFDDRECIHSVKYRIAKTVNKLPILAENLIAVVPASTRGTSSWPRWFNPAPMK